MGPSDETMSAVVGESGSDESKLRIDMPRRLEQTKTISSQGTNKRKADRAALPIASPGPSGEVCLSQITITRRQSASTDPTDMNAIDDVTTLISSVRANVTMTMENHNKRIKNSAMEETNKVTTEETSLRPQRSDGEKLTSMTTVDTKPSTSSSPSESFRQTSNEMDARDKPGPPTKNPIPEHLLGVLIAPFLWTRQSYNNFSRTNGEIYRACKTLTPPWPKRTFKLDAMVQAVAFEPTDGHLLACAARESVYVWNRRSGHQQMLHTSCAWPSTILTCLAISPDGRYLVAGHRTASEYSWSDDHGNLSDSDYDYDSDASSNEHNRRRSPSITIWDLDKILQDKDAHNSSEKYSRTLYGHSPGGVLSVAFSPDSKMIATGGVDHSVRLWCHQDNEFRPRAVLHGHSNWVYSVRFSPADGGLLATSAEEDTSVRLWDLSNLPARADHANTQFDSDNEDDSLIRSIDLSGHSECVHCVTFSSDGYYLASGSDDETVRLWDLTRPGAPRCFRVLRGFGSPVWTIAWASADVIVSGGHTRGLFLHSAIDGACLAKLRGQDVVTSVAVSPSGRTIASSSLDRTVRTYNLAHEISRRRGAGNNGNSNGVTGE